MSAAVRRERLAVIAAILTCIAASWYYLARSAAAMEPMDPGMSMAGMQSWPTPGLAALFVMWAVMMVAMMLPSATPMLLLFGNVQRSRGAQQQPVVHSGVFAAGYLSIWIAFAAVASTLQWALHSAALLSPAMTAKSPIVAGVLLVFAGVYQWTPLKRMCLSHCRSPLGFLTTEWREGVRGAFVMGARHGVFCVGCCWLLMALLFAGGVMNLLWVAALSGVVLLEKAVPGGAWIGRVGGVLFAVAGIWLLLQR